MPKALAWYKHYPEDFLTGVKAMTLEERGAYITVLDLLYENGGAIADDTKWIARICNCSTRKWSAIRARLILADKLFPVGDKLSNIRAETELHKFRKSSFIASINGALGGRTRVENERARNGIKDLQNQGLKPGLSYARAYSRKEVSTSLMDEATVPSPAPQEGKREEKAVPSTTVQPLPNWRDQGDAEELKPTSALLNTRMMRTH